MSQSLVWFALTEFLLSVSPGPAVFLVMSQSMRHGLQSGFGAIAGILGINVFYFLLSVLGVGVTLAASPTAFAVLKYLGAAYLIWMASEILRDLVRRSPSPTLVASGAGAQTVDWRQSVPSGIAVQASSIKNILIFLAIIPQFIDPAGNVPLQFAALCLVSIVVELPVLAGYAYLATSLANRVGSTSMRTCLELTSALLLAGIAGYVLFSQ